jgi:hypothetical protein
VRSPFRTIRSSAACNPQGVGRPRTTPESSVNYAFFSLGAFAAESWPLAQREDTLTELVLCQGFTVSWDIGQET